MMDARSPTTTLLCSDLNCRRGPRLQLMQDPDAAAAELTRCVKSTSALCQVGLLKTRNSELKTPFMALQ